MTGMGRTPGETTEQWSFRANSDYLDAWTALRVASCVLRAAGWRFPDSSYPLLDEAHDDAMDALDAADQERIEASIAVDRERHPIQSG
jgi:hypothetical protein